MASARADWLLLLAMFSVAGCVDYTSSTSGDAGGGRQLACLNAAPAGLDGKPAHSPQAAACLRAFVGIQGRTISREARASLAGHGFHCAPNAVDGETICSLAYTRTTTLRNEMGSGDSFETQQTRVSLGFTETVVTQLLFERTTSTAIPGATRPDVLTERSANLVDD